MGVKGLMKPLDYHIESEKISSRETKNDLEKERCNIYHTSISMPSTNKFFFW